MSDNAFHLFMAATATMVILVVAAVVLWLSYIDRANRLDCIQVRGTWNFDGCQIGGAK